MKTLKQIQRIAVAAAGATVLAVGVVLLILPGPAFVVIPVGLGILALEFAWARRWLTRAREMLQRTQRSVGGEGSHPAKSRAKEG